MSTRLGAKEILALFTLYFVWGSTYLGIRYAIVTLPPLLMAGARHFLAGVILFVWCRRISGDASPSLREWKASAIVGTSMLLGGNGAVVWAEQYVASGLAALIVATVPLWMLILEGVWLKQWKLFRSSLLPILLGFAGVGVLVFQSGSDPGGLQEASPALVTLALLILCGGSFSWAFGSLYGRSGAQPRSAFLASALQMITGGVALALAGLARGEGAGFVLAQVSLQSWLSFAYLVLAGSLLAFVAYVWLMRQVSSVLVSTYAFVNPVVAVALGTVVGGERLSPGLVAGGGLIFVCVVWVFVKKLAPGRGAGD